jgi:DNA polymerase-3 subunit epsilon
MFVVYDFETSGLPLYQGVRSDDPRQPHIVEAAAVLCEPGGEIVDRVDVLVRPDDWVFDEDAVAVHGITEQRAAAEGIAEPEALELLQALFDRAQTRVAHSEAFDAKIMRIAMKRYQGPEAADAWAGRHTRICTLAMARRVLSLKANRLNDIHRALFGADIAGAHKAMPDVMACRAIYLRLLEQQSARDAMLLGLPPLVPLPEMVSFDA